MDQNIQQYVFGHTCVSLSVPVAKQIQEHWQQGKFAQFPYWAKVWPSALALSGFIAQHPHYIKGKNLLELAGGLGLPALVAAAEAKTVCCSDCFDEPLSFVRQSIQQNQIRNIDCRVINWHHLTEIPEADVLLLSDVNYDPAEFDSLYTVLLRFLDQKTTILLSTPQRLMAKTFIARVLPWLVTRQEMLVTDASDTTEITVLVLKQRCGEDLA